MLIEVNGKKREVEEGYTLTALVNDLGFALDGTAVAVDETIVPKSSFNDFVLKANMKVDIFNLVAGG